jgi:hypothetical protein
MNKGRTNEERELAVRTAREARGLTGRFYKDLDAIWSRRADYDPGQITETMVWLVFKFAQHKLGDEAARDLFAQLGPKPKRQIQEERKYQLV